ncbi:MAG: diaminopimelate decarboxylase [Firmicutes bacterium]|nr:diaminopimelate decarboxylase [Bacillota bacterium]
MRLNGTMRINDRGHLEIGGCDTVELAQHFGTPLYVMDEALIRENCCRYYRSFVEKFGKAEVIYASKAFMNLAMCCLVEEEGLGLDVVSGGELYTALRAKFPPQRIYFHGNNKSREELRMALEAKVGRIVVDNAQELELLQELAAQFDTRANILLRITPGIEAHTHEYIRTGQIDSKFGFPLPTGQAMSAIKRALQLPSLVVRGLHCHIGSQIFELESYRYTARVMMDFVAEVTATTGLIVEELDLGGGFGIYYASNDSPAEIEEYADIVMETVREEAMKKGLLVPKVIVEPGRSIVGPAGTTLYTIGTIKEIPGIRTYVAVDGGMGDNPRPALYGARYEAIIANKATVPPTQVVSITGKYCESGDMLIWDIPLAPPSRGDILAVSATGAYNYSMSMNYNRLGRPAVVFVRDGEADVVVEREGYEDLLRNDIIPERMKRKRVVKLASMK